jgi:hypothetical protein
VRKNGDFVARYIENVGFFAGLDGIRLGQETDGADASGIGIFGETEDFLIRGFVEGGGNRTVDG